MHVKAGVSTDSLTFHVSTHNESEDHIVSASLASTRSSSLSLARHAYNYDCLASHRLHLFQYHAAHASGYGCAIFLTYHPTIFNKPNNLSTGVYRDVISTMRNAPQQIPLMLGNLRQELEAERTAIGRRVHQGDEFNVFPRRVKTDRGWKVCVLSHFGLAQ